MILVVDNGVDIRRFVHIAAEQQEKLWTAWRSSLSFPRFAHTSRGEQNRLAQKEKQGDLDTSSTDPHLLLLLLI